MFRRFGYTLLFSLPLVAACQSTALSSSRIQLLTYDQSNVTTLTRPHWVEVGYSFAGLPEHGQFSIGFEVDAGQTPAQVAEAILSELDDLGGDRPPEDTEVFLSLGSQRGRELPHNLEVSSVDVHVVGEPDQTELRFKVAIWARSSDLYFEEDK